MIEMEATDDVNDLVVQDFPQEIYELLQFIAETTIGHEYEVDIYGDTPQERVRNLIIDLAIERSLNEKGLKKTKEFLGGNCPKYFDEYNDIECKANRYSANLGL